MNRTDSRTPRRGQPDSKAASFADTLTFSARIVSRSYEPPAGWRGVLSEMLPNVLVFESDDGCSPLLPTLLPAFCLIAPALPDFPGAARVEWNHGTEADIGGEPRDIAWLPASVGDRLVQGSLLEHVVVSGRSVWRLEGTGLIAEAPRINRPRLVLAPPTRRNPRDVQLAVVNSLERAVRSVPPESDLERLVEVSRTYIAETSTAQPLDGPTSLSDLVGFGAGRTAYGDDYLVGFICGIDLGSSIDPRIDATKFHEFRSALVAAVHESFPRTTLLGRHVLLAAFHGLYSAPLLEEADALGDAIIVGPGEPEWSLVRRPTVSPGWPALLGLLAGAFSVCSNQRLRRASSALSSD